MARGRMINKKISNDKRVNDMPLQAQLLFTWLVPHLDCNGCFYGSAQMIKSLVIPRKNWSKKMVEKCLSVMENSKSNEGTPLICRYTVNSEAYLYMPGFPSEQTGLRYDKEKPEFPTFDGKNTENGGQESPLREGEGEVEIKEETNSSSFNIEKVIEVFESNILDDSQVTEEMQGELEKAVSIYSAAWVLDAIREAVRANKRSWLYIAGVLKNWKRYGRSPS